MPSKDLSWLAGELRALAGDLNSEAPSSPLVIAIDQGGHASRAIAFDIRGRAGAESFAPISTFRTGHDRVEHDALEVVESIRTALGDLHRSLGSDSNRVVAAGLATQRSSIASWDSKNDKPLAPIVSWQDRRNAAFVKRLGPHAAAIRARTGLVLSAHYGASKMRWCADNLAAVREAAANRRLVIGPLATWLLRKLIKERPQVTDVSNAACTQLLDVSTCEWSQQMLDLFGVRREVLPSVVPNRHGYGHIAFGDRFVPLTVCTGDQSAMPFAYARPQLNTLYLNVGTGAFVQRISDSPDAPDGLLGSILWLDATNERVVTHAIEGTINGAGSAIDWLNEHIGIDAHRASMSMTRAQVAQLNPPIFLNGISGVGSPYWRSEFESRFIGEGNELERVAAVIESIAFLICVNVERMSVGADRILASGGLSASNYLCECLATLSGITVERTTLQESTATGLAYLVAGEPSDWQPDAKLERFPPTADANLSARFERWRAEMGKPG